MKGSGVEEDGWMLRRCCGASGGGSGSAHSGPEALTSPPHPALANPPHRQSHPPTWLSFSSSSHASSMEDCLVACMLMQ